VLPSHSTMENKLVWSIQKKIESDVARPTLGWRKEYFYRHGRMQEVWLDK